MVALIIIIRVFLATDHRILDQSAKFRTDVGSVTEVTHRMLQERLTSRRPFFFFLARFHYGFLDSRSSI